MVPRPAFRFSPAGREVQRLALPRFSSSRLGHVSVLLLGKPGKELTAEQGPEETNGGCPASMRLGVAAEVLLESVKH